MTLMTSQAHIGERLRQLRTGRGLSVRTLAATAGFSPSFISQVENGLVSPSIASLESIAAILGTTLGGFFAEPVPRPAVVVRAMDRQEITSAWSRATIERLGPTGGTRMLEALMITLAREGRSGTRPHAALGEQFALVFAGKVTLTLPDGSYELTHGDAVSIAAGTAHQWQNIGVEPVRVLLVTARAGA